MYTNSKSSAKKWLDPPKQEKEEYDEYDEFRQYSSRNNPYIIYSGPVKVLTSKEPMFADDQDSLSLEQYYQKQTTNSNISNSNISSSVGGQITRSKIYSLNIHPKRLALSYTVPTIIIEYLVPKTGKLYHHKIKIRELKAQSDSEKVLVQIKKRHGMYLTKIPDKQLINLIENLKKNIKRQEVEANKEPAITQTNKDENTNKKKQEQKSDKKMANIINPFSRNKALADSQLSMEEKELCGKLKSEFDDDFEEGDEENQGYGEDQEYDYDFEEFSENGQDVSNNVLKPFSQDTSHISNSNNEVKITPKQQGTQQVDLKHKNQYIKSKPVTKNAKGVYDDGINLSDSDEMKQIDYSSKEQNDDEFEESDGYRDFDVDAKAIYMSQFTKKGQTKSKTKEESQYSDEQEEEGDYDEDEQDENEVDEEDEDYDLEDIENLNINNIVNEKQNKQQQNSDSQKNNFMQQFKQKQYEQKQISPEQKQISDEKLKQVKFQQGLSSKRPEVQLKSGLQQAENAIGGFVPKKNNYLDADEQIEFDDDNEFSGEDEFNMDFAELKNKKEQEQEDDDEEEDIYQQVKNKLTTVQQKKETNPSSHYQKNLQQKKYEIAYYQNQKEQQQEEEDEFDNLSDNYKEEDEYDQESNGEGQDNNDEDDDENGEEGDEYGDEEEQDQDNYDLEDIDDQYQKEKKKYENIQFEQNHKNGQSNQNGTDQKQQIRIKVTKQKSLLDDLENEVEENIPDNTDYDHLDLNKLSTKELDEHKKKMDKQYEQNRKKPGDFGFVYDVRKDFDPAVSNDWDVSKSQDKHDTEEIDYDIV